MPMPFPTYFARIPRLTLHDRLAEFLGAPGDGLIDYGYDDAVKLAGHSCPTVAGAYLMAWHGLHHLYADDFAQRGDIVVEIRDAFDSGTTGVVAKVLELITGAATTKGFKGLGGQFARCGLMRDRRTIDGPVRLTRCDTGAACRVDYRPQCVPAAPEMPQIMRAALAGDEQARHQLAQQWQARVERILTLHFDDPDLIVVRSTGAEPVSAA